CALAGRASATAAAAAIIMHRIRIREGSFGSPPSPAAGEINDPEPYLLAPGSCMWHGASKENGGAALVVAPLPAHASGKLASTRVASTVMFRFLKSSAVAVVDRRREAVIGQARWKFQEFAHKTGRHCRNRIDPQHRRAWGPDHLVGHAADQA